MRANKLILAGVVAGAAVIATPAMAQPSGKVWLCHFPGHDAAQPYGDDRNGAVDGFWSTPSGENLDGDYVVAYSPDPITGAVPNSGQHGLCEGNGGEFILVSENALKGHEAQNQIVLSTYPEGYKG